MSSIIVAAPPVTGEVEPLLGIAGGLVRRGHAVTMVTGSRFGARVAAVGARFVPLTGTADYDDRRFLNDESPEAATVAPGPDQLNFLMGALIDSIPDQHRLLQELLAVDPDAGLVTNSLFFGAWAMGLGAPGRRPRRWVAVGCNPVGLPSDDTGPLGPVPPGPGGDARAANRAANAAFDAALEPSRRRVEAAMRALGATAAVPAIAEGMFTVPEVFAALTVPGLEFERSDAPDSLHLVGVLPAPIPAAGWTPPSWWHELESARPVVVVTQGTLANDDLGQLVAPTLDALADQDVLVVAALGRGVDALPGPVPANARVEEFIPFGPLLPRVDVLVTNGGFGATQQALAAGIPVVLAGTTEEKPMVAARVAAAGVGRDLATATPSSATPSWTCWTTPRCAPTSIGWPPSTPATTRSPRSSTCSPTTSCLETSTRNRRGPRHLPPQIRASGGGSVPDPAAWRNRLFLKALS